MRAVCSTPCDADCDADCHEAHQVRAKREHDPADCSYLLEDPDPQPISDEWLARVRSMRAASEVDLPEWSP